MNAFLKRKYSSRQTKIDWRCRKGRIEEGRLTQLQESILTDTSRQLGKASKQKRWCVDWTIKAHRINFHATRALAKNVRISARNRNIGL